MKQHFEGIQGKLKEGLNYCLDTVKDEGISYFSTNVPYYSRRYEKDQVNYNRPWATGRCG